MDEDLEDFYDVIIQGTGLVECLLAGAAARVGKTVLHLDKNSFYGGQWASFNLSNVDEWATKQLDLSYCAPGDAPRGEGISPANGESLLPLVLPDCSVYSNARSSWDVKNICPVTDAAAPVDPPSLSALNNDAPISANDSTNGDEATLQDSSAKDDASSAPQVSKSNSVKSWDYQSLLDSSRRFNIDLAPNILYSRGDMVELLISSNVSRYVEFKCLSRILCWREGGTGLQGGEGGLVPVPCSRAQVFSSKAVSLLEKRLLMKFLQFAASYTEQPERWTGLKSAPLRELLTKERVTGQLQDFVLRGMALSGSDVTVESGLRALRLFLTSLGRYGASPFLATLYGSGELPQAFCRLCAVFGGTYVLQRGISALISGDRPVMAPEPTSADSCKPTATSTIAREENQEVASDKMQDTNIDLGNSQSIKDPSPESVEKEEMEGVEESTEHRHVVAVVSDGRRIGCRHLVLEDAFASAVEGCSDPSGGSSISRAVLVLTCDLLQELSSTASPKVSAAGDNDEDGVGTASKEGGVSLAQLSAPDGRSVTAIQFASDTGTCASGSWLLHLTCDGSNAQNDLRPSVEQLLQHHKRQVPDQSSDAPTTLPIGDPLLYSLYFNQRVHENVSCPYPNLHFCGGPRNKLDYFDAIAQARDIFKRVCPDEEFMPRAPDPDEIIFDDPSPEQQKPQDDISNEPSDENLSQDPTKADVEEKDTDGKTVDKPDEESSSPLSSAL